MDREEKLIELGSRNFFLCPGKSKTTVDGGNLLPALASCSKQADKDSKPGFGWLKFIDFLL